VGSGGHVLVVDLSHAINGLGWWCNRRRGVLMLEEGGREEEC